MKARLRYRRSEAKRDRSDSSLGSTKPVEKLVVQVDNPSKESKEELDLPRKEVLDSAGDGWSCDDHQDAKAEDVQKACFEVVSPLVSPLDVERFNHESPSETSSQDFPE